MSVYTSALDRTRCVRFLLLLVLVQFACATPEVHKRWKALDAVESVSFAADDFQENEAVLRWRVASRQLPVRSGKSTVTIYSPRCEHLEFWVAGRKMGVSANSEWISVDLKRDGSDRTPAERSETLPVCAVEVRPRRWVGESSPTFDLIYQRKVLGELTTHPRRRLSWLLVYPFAIVTDIVLATPVAIVVIARSVLPQLDDFTWVPGREPNWNRQESERKREERKRELYSTPDSGRIRTR